METGDEKQNTSFKQSPKSWVAERFSGLKTTLKVDIPPTWKQNAVVRFVRQNLLIVLMVLAIVIGVSLGIGLRDHWSPSDARKIHFLRFPGDLLMNMLKMLILPLIVSSLISSLAALDTHASGRLGVRAIVYYLTTTLAAVIIGIILVLAIQPGHQGSGEYTRAGKERDGNPIDALLDLIR